MALDKTWFSEICEESGTAFSVKIQEKLHTVEGSLQTIDIYATEEYGNMMVIDGFIMITDRDNQIYHEMISHPALFCHKNPRKLAIIGGGDCGTLKEVLKHKSIESVTLVEIDENVVLLAKKFFPVLAHAAEDDRATILHENGAEWIKKHSDLDIILIDSTDPIGPAQDLFSEAFYKNCHKALADGGIMVQQSESPLYHMNILKPMQKSIRQAGFASTQIQHFFQSSYPSGWWTCTMAAKDASTDLRKFNEQASTDKPFDTFYYNAGIHKASMVSPEFFKREMEEN